MKKSRIHRNKKNGEKKELKIKNKIYRKSQKRLIVGGKLMRKEVLGGAKQINDVKIEKAKMIKDEIKKGFFFSNFKIMINIKAGGKNDYPNLERRKQPIKTTKINKTPAKRPFSLNQKIKTDMCNKYRVK